MAQKAKKKSKLRHAEYYDMQKTFDSLYADSKSGEVFGHLMDIISAPNNIKLAFRNIKGNDGSHTAGTDGRTIESLAVMSEDILSFITTAVTTYLKCFDLKAMEKQHKDAAEHFLVVRNELLHLIGEIHMQEKSVNELDEKFHGIEETLNALYLSAPSTTDDAVVAASIALGTNKDYTYTNDEIDRFLPPTLKGTIKKKEYVDGTSN